ncbi:TonB-dependent receptor [Sphingomonadaceae bacterium G21617-S1]|nr:TonB-dependent receptor [Sphingomonadaceae bacterium G21617-S1]
MKLSTYLLGVSIAALLAPMAHAQEQTDPGLVEDIVVTAQKRSERLQDVPIAVSAASAAQLENSGIKDLQQLTAIVPGLNVTAALGSFQPSIRGIATSSNVVENPVALYIDGVYLPQQQEGLRDLADAEQITVLKGPQGTLFGRNATAGVIQIATRSPEFQPSAQFNLSYGSYQTIRTNAFVTTGLTDTVAASLSGAYQSQGKGWGESLTTGREENKLYHSYSLRGKLLANLGDATTVTLAGDYLNRRDSGVVYQPYPGTSLVYAGFGPVTNRYDSYNGTGGYTYFRGGGVAMTIDSEFSFAKLVSISSYREGDFGFKFDLTNVAAPILISTAAGKSRTISQEIQLISTASGPIKWVTGAYYFNYRQGYDFFNRDFGTGVNATTGLPYRFSPLQRSANSGYEKSESIAPFAQADWEFLPDTTFTGGLRYTYEKRSLNDGRTQLTNPAGVVLPQTIVPPKSLTFKEFTYRAALNHKFNDDVMVFASYNHGFKSGGFNIATPAAAGYLPEKLDDWEIGLKSQFLDRRLTFNVNGFYYKYKNIQVTQFIGNPPTQIVSNGARAELYGVDIDLIAKVAPGFTLSGGIELIHPEFTSYPGAPFGTNLPTGGVATAPGNAKGQRVPFARKFVGTIAADYMTPFMGGNLALNLTATRSGDYYFEVDNFVRQPAYTMLNAAVKLSDAEDKFSLRFGVTNALNKSIFIRNATLAFGRLVAYGSPPREYTLSLGAKF